MHSLGSGMNAVTIAGVGLIGGSFALALRKAGFRGPIYGVSSPATIARALAAGVISEGLPLKEAISRSGLVYLAQPIARIIEILPEVERWAAPGTVVTDAGSTKQIIVQRAAEVFHKAHFVGGHPMAGKESRGVASADADLFCGRAYVLTPLPEQTISAPPVGNLLDLVRKIGARPVVIDAATHDRVVAYTSHLPQLASTALAAALTGCNLSKDSLLTITGPGLRDQTRLALSPFDVWQDILSTNIDGVREALSTYIDELGRIRELIGSPEMREAFKRAETFAQELRQGRKECYEK